MAPKMDQEWHKETLQFTYVPNSDAEKRLMRKIDIRIIPTVWILYTLSYLDHTDEPPGSVHSEFTDLPIHHPISSK
ncbi:hypothetical protein EDD85DRAFT_951715 [Armillaria nabsnona]|nr:hypothetical protein EDD85DRAFT_951715 [Armillaria nabsnona]